MHDRRFEHSLDEEGPPPKPKPCGHEWYYGGCAADGGPAYRRCRWCKVEERWTKNSWKPVGDDRMTRRPRK